MDREQSRDMRAVWLYDCVAAITLVGALNNFGGYKDGFWVVFWYSALTGLRTYIDVSHRNFFLHARDWERERSIGSQ